MCVFCATVKFLGEYLRLEQTLSIHNEDLFIVVNLVFYNFTTQIKKALKSKTFTLPLTN
jgi:hypothetical protein